MAQLQSSYLRPEEMRRLASYEFAPRALVEGYFAGRHRSFERGSSTEFRDFRQYVPGDDPRLVDWKVFARTDRFYLRTHQQETSMNCYLFLDCSASMGFGENPTKLAFASFFTAALAYLVIKGKDRLALNLFDSDIREFFPPGSTSRHLHLLLNALERNQPGSRTSIATAIRRSEPLLKERGSLVVVSDFLDDPAELFDAFSSYLHRGFRIYLFQVLAPEEIDLPDHGLVAFHDLETGERVKTHTANIRDGYRVAMDDHIRHLRQLAQRRQIHHSLARTDRSFFHLFDVLATRKR